MAQLSQENLNAMVKSMNDAITNYENSVKTGEEDFKNQFNEIWVSNRSDSLVSEISTCVTEMAGDIGKYLANLNDRLKTADKNFNLVEDENMTYSGFSCPTLAMDIKLNASLPGTGNKRGVMRGTSLTDLQKPMTTLQGEINDSLMDIKNAAETADAFSEVEVSALVNGIEKVRSKFESSLEELADSLQSRLEGEDVVTIEGDKTNVENLNG